MSELINRSTETTARKVVRNDGRRGDASWAMPLRRDRQGDASAGLGPVSLLYPGRGGYFCSKER